MAQVPFVDVVTTMLDDSIPLTTGEYEEGQPAPAAAYALMKSYSSYDNVRAALPEPAGYQRLVRLAGAVLGAGQMGGEALRRFKQGDSLLLPPPT
ncbi:prolyl oligopeptidase family serine peptidase [Serratia ureilytica]